MARNCDNWLKSFGEWTLPRTQVAESMLMWGGLFTLACALRRRVYIGRKYLGGWECYPYLYILNVGPQGYGKSTAINFGQRLIKDIPEIVKAANVNSVAVLHVELSKSEDHSLVVTASEMSDIVAKAGAEIYEFLTAMFDGPDEYVAKTISRGTDFAYKPCINFTAGTTPIWLAKNLPPEVIGGGFAGRTIVIYEDTWRQKKMYHLGVDHTSLDALEGKLKADLSQIAKLEGEFTITKDALEYVEDWFQKHNPEKYHPKLQGYYRRKHVHLHKVAMLWHVAYSDNLTITQHDFECALNLLSMIEGKMIKAFEGVGKNVYVFDMKEIHAFIMQNGPIARNQLLDHFSSVAEPDRLDMLIGALITLKKIKMVNEQGTIYYAPAH